MDNLCITRANNNDILDYMTHYNMLTRGGGAFYASDLHLNYNFNISKRQRKGIIGRLVDTFNEDMRRFELQEWCPLLLAGDISDKPEYFFMFCDFLVERWHGGPVCIVAGNHDDNYLYNENFAAQLQKYREHQIYVLRNELFYVDFESEECEPRSESIMRPKSWTTHVLSWNDIEKLGPDGVNYMLRNAVYCIYAGEYAQSLPKGHFMLDCLKRRNSILLSHYPEAFFQDNELGPFGIVLDKSGIADGIVRVFGHGHHNQAEDDGSCRFYADNQFSYWLQDWTPSSKKTRHLKFFQFDMLFDPLAYLNDGIHHISVSKYVRFLNYLGIGGTCNRFEDQGITCIKRNGFYCFMVKTKSGCWAILNGGNIKRTRGAGPEEVYDKMPQMIAAINLPMSRFSKYLNTVSEAVKRFGGKGYVHGCLVDIDFFDHIYVNPFDGTLTPYFATDIVKKIVYPDMPTLLSSDGQEQLTALNGITGGINDGYIDPSEIDRCREGLLQKYLSLPRSDRLLMGNDNSGPDMFAIQKTSGTECFPDIVTKLSAPVVYTSTDIYSASRVILKMQALENRILKIWDEDALAAYEKHQAEEQSILTLPLENQPLIQRPATTESEV